MFGFIVANKDSLTEAQLARYKGCYCGLCKALRENCGSLSRMTLTYDMTFLILLLSSMYEPEEESGTERCVMHPMKEHQYWQNEITGYAADMNLALAYLNCLDDWKDDRKLLKRAEAGMLRGEYFRVRAKYPEKCAFIEARIEELSEIECENDPNPDAGAHCFGRIMGEVFEYKPDSVWEKRLREFGEELGEFIYIMDAVVDLEKDAKKGSYNAVAALAASRTDEELRNVLTMLIGEAAIKFEKLPIVRDVDIMRNILYSGVWMRYNAMKAKKQTEGGTAGDE